MRIVNVGAGRPQYYDRTPLAVSTVGFQALGVAPHAGTFRGQYTVPTNRKAQVAATFLSVMRATAAAPVGKAIMWSFKASDPGSMEAAILTNTPGDQSRIAFGQATILLAGDILSEKTSDASTGGTVDYNGIHHIYEFDA